MSLTPSKEELLLRLNSKAVADHQDATDKAFSQGKAAPPPPVPLKPEEIEFPKWLHKDWKANSQNEGFWVPGESKLAKNAEHMAELQKDGFSDAPPTASKGAHSSAAKEQASLSDFADDSKHKKAK